MLTRRAPQACQPCRSGYSTNLTTQRLTVSRRLKRKCTRETPSCSLCLRLNKSCHYPETPSDPLSEDPALLREKIKQLEQQLHREIQSEEEALLVISSTEKSPKSLGSFGAPLKTPAFPVLYFLDSASFSKLSSDVLDPGMPVPSKIINIIGNTSDIHSICTTYFLTVHNWLPMLSKKRLLPNIGDFNTTTDASLALLLISMKLVCDLPTEVDPIQTSLYWMVKQFFSLCENSCLMSLSLLQSSILISVYEIGHGIYPAAYLSISHSARLGVIMGLHDKKHASQMFKRPDTWTLSEEERRTWFSVLILDRYVNIGTKGFPLATGEPSRDELLPCDDLEWSNGEIGINVPLFTSTISFDANISTYARTCQAAHLLGQVLHHRDDHNLDHNFRLQQAVQLHRTLVALDSVVQNTSECSAFALCCSARFLLYSVYVCNKQGYDDRIMQETEMQKISMSGIKCMIESVYRVALSMLQTLERDPLSISPLISTPLYYAASECAWFIREDGDAEMKVRMGVILDALRVLDKRWRIGGEYINLLQHEGSLSADNDLYRVV